MPFELYKGYHVFDAEETVSITPVDLLNISRVLSERYFNGIKYVELYFDADNKAVGIKPLRQESAHSYAVIRTKAGRRVAICARGFLHQYNLVSEANRKFKPQTFVAAFNEKEGMLIFRVRKGD